jgi:hypothetical protein
MRHRIKRSLSPELETSFPTLPLGDQVSVLRAMVGRHYSIWNSGNEYHGRPPSEYDQFQRALECGKSYLVGDTWTMAAYKAAYRSATTYWQRLACLICWGHPETRLNLEIEFPKLIYAIYRRGEYVEIGLPHQEHGGEKHWDTIQPFKSKFLVNVD